MLYAIVIYDEPNTAALRDELRQAHLDYLKTFDAQTLFAGPFTTDDESADLGSLRLTDMPDLAAVEKHIADEPYVTGGVQKRWKIHTWKPTKVTTWRDCPRREGNVQMLFHAFYRPGIMAQHKDLRQAHLDYLDAHPEEYMARGPLFDAAGVERVGSLLLLDVPSLKAGRQLMAAEPYNKAGIYDDVELNRWRFGRVFDRFKV